MEPTNDGTAPDGTQQGTGSATTPDGAASGEADPIALARKRQAGAEAARQKAEEERNAALKELEGYRAKERTAEDQKLADTAKLQERLDREKARADEAEAKAQARILDTLYPNARKELPEVTDEVRLAKFEALLSDPTEPVTKTPPAPQNPNESNRAASGAGAAAKPAEKSSADLLAELKAGGLPPDWP